ncbi:MAG: superoxide dismutase [Ni] [Thermoanaerobaculales bacterium]
MNRIVLTSLVLFFALVSAAPAAAHCQIPCGIYDDELRVEMIEEDITTVEKSMKKIVALGKADPVNYNQLVRWVDNKEEHAQKIQDIVTAYFMAQRIKPADPDAKERGAYVNQLTLLHAIQIHAMKAKQSTDLDQIEALRKLVAEFREAYFGEEGGHGH